MFQVRVREERKCCCFVSAVYSRHGGRAGVGATRVYTGYGRRRDLSLTVARRVLG